MLIEKEIFYGLGELKAFLSRQTFDVLKTNLVFTVIRKLRDLILIKKFVNAIEELIH